MWKTCSLVFAEDGHEKLGELKSHLKDIVPSVVQSFSKTPTLFNLC